MKCLTPFKILMSPVSSMKYCDDSGCSKRLCFETSLRYSKTSSVVFMSCRYSSLSEKMRLYVLSRPSRCDERSPRLAAYTLNPKP